MSSLAWVTVTSWLALEENGKLLETLIANIRLGQMCVPATNTPAYHATAKNVW